MEILYVIGGVLALMLVIGICLNTKIEWGDPAKKQSGVKRAIKEPDMQPDEYMDEPITEKQRRYLLHLGAKKQNMPKTKYEASLLIDEYLAAGKK